MALLGADGRPVKEVPKPLTVSWAFVVGVDKSGVPHVIDPGDAHEVRAARPVVIDDIYAACSVLEEYSLGQVQDEPYATAFIVFCLTDGHVVASPDVFENIAPLGYPTEAQVKGATHVLRSQVISQETAKLAAGLAADATLSRLGMAAKAQADAEANARAQQLISKTRND